MMTARSLLRALAARWRIRTRHLPACALLLLAGAAFAPSQTLAQGAAAWPARPIRFVVSFPPGGPSDLMARLIAERVGATLRQPVVVENRAGAAGYLGAEAVARSPADGYTVLMGVDSTLTITPTLSPPTSWKPSDLRPLMVLATSGLMFAVHPSLGVRTLADFLALGRRQEITFSSAGNGSPGHLASALLADRVGVKVVHVPYKGNTPAVMGLVSGEVQAAIIATPGLLPHAQAGKILPFALTSARRSTLMPELPTVAEAGLPALQFEVNYMAWVPAATPPAVVAILQREIAAALSQAEVRARLQPLDLDVVADTSPNLSARLDLLRERYALTIKATGMKAD